MSHRKSDLGIPLPYIWLNPSTRPSPMSETFAQEIARVQLEIAERQARLAALVAGDPRVSVTLGPAFLEHPPGRRGECR
jgi:hypothetical protein